MMINLPKPSELLMKSSSKGQNAYILSYLKTLVSSLEKAIPSSNGDEKESARYVKDIRPVNGNLKVLFSDGESKELSISDNS